MKRTIVNPIFKDSVTFLQTSAETNGRTTQLEVTLMAKGRNVLHCHAYPEKFTAIDGDLGLENEKKEQKILKSGESYTVESMAWHCFYNPTDREIRFGVQVEPANERLEYFLRISLRDGGGRIDRQAIQTEKHQTCGNPAWYGRG